MILMALTAALMVVIITDNSIDSSFDSNEQQYQEVYESIK